MAEGFLCVHCGKQETEHVFRDVLGLSIKEINEILPGYTHSLKTCPGFKYSQEDLEEHLKIMDEEGEIYNWEVDELRKDHRSRL